MPHGSCFRGTRGFSDRQIDVAGNISFFNGARRDRADGRLGWRTCSLTRTTRMPAASPANLDTPFPAVYDPAVLSKIIFHRFKS